MKWILPLLLLASAGCAPTWPGRHQIIISVNGNPVSPERHWMTDEDFALLSKEENARTIEYLRSRGVADPEKLLRETRSAKMPEIPGPK